MNVQKAYDKTNERFGNKLPSWDVQDETLKKFFNTFASYLSETETEVLQKAFDDLIKQDSKVQCVKNLVPTRNMKRKRKVHKIVRVMSDGTHRPVKDKLYEKHIKQGHYSPRRAREWLKYLNDHHPKQIFKIV